MIPVPSGLTGLAGTRADIVRIIGTAKVLDRAKTRCGERALAWNHAVRRDLAK
ncbi:hypothetical protein M2440_000037 [Methylorubrum extorquens]|nr:hypothetical protein [Methylorubrum extorquens]